MSTPTATQNQQQSLGHVTQATAGSHRLTKSEQSRVTPDHYAKMPEEVADKGMSQTPFSTQFAHVETLFPSLQRRTTDRPGHVRIPIDKLFAGRLAVDPAEWKIDEGLKEAWRKHLAKGRSGVRNTMLTGAF